MDVTRGGFPADAAPFSRNSPPDTPAVFDTMPEPTSGGDVAVLMSGGVDSAVLCIDLVTRGQRVFPLYVRFGLRWEEAELASVGNFLQAVERPGLMPLSILEEPVADVYGPHWSTGGSPVPDAESDDEAVYLPGRNVLLVAKAAVWCLLRDIDALALGCLRSNPFPDSTPAFFRELQSVLNMAMNGRIRLIRPLEACRKEDVIRKGIDLPLRHTFSCLSPVGDLHCGLCNKCAERRRGFRKAGVADETPYAASFAATP